MYDDGGDMEILLFLHCSSDAMGSPLMDVKEYKQHLELMSFLLLSIVTCVYQLSIFIYVYNLFI